MELVDQAFRTFEQLWAGTGAAPDMTLSRAAGLGPQDDLMVQVTTPQAVYAYATRRASAMADPDFDVVVFDEAHQLGARTFRAAADYLRRGVNKPPLIGLSATPGRVDQKETEDLVSYFGGNLFTSRQLRPNPVKVLQRRGILAGLLFKRLTVGARPVDAESSRVAVAAHQAASLAASGGRVLVFAGSVAGAVVAAEAVRSLGQQAGVVHAAMSDSERRRVIADFSSGKIRVLTNQKLLATGYDCPAISDLILVSRVGSPILFEQIVGRAARGPRTGGSRRSTVWEFDDHLSLHGLPQSYYRFRDFDWS